MCRIVSIGLVLWFMQTFAVNCHIVKQTMEVTDTPSALSTTPANDMISRIGQDISTTAPEFTTLATKPPSTTAESDFLRHLEKYIDEEDFGFKPKQTPLLAALMPHYEYLAALAPYDDMPEEKMTKITFAGRTHFQVRHNCRCYIHGRCAKADQC